jgi:hypothetical protein
MHASFLENWGESFLQMKENARSGLNFLGDIAVSLGRLMIGRSYFRWGDFMVIVQRCGVESLFLVAVISLLGRVNK